MKKILLFIFFTLPILSIFGLTHNVFADDSNCEVSIKDISFEEKREISKESVTSLGASTMWGGSIPKDNSIYLRNNIIINLDVKNINNGCDNFSQTFSFVESGGNSLPDKISYSFGEFFEDGNSKHFNKRIPVFHFCDENTGNCSFSLGDGKGIKFSLVDKNDFFCYKPNVNYPSLCNFYFKTTTEGGSYTIKSESSKKDFDGKSIYYTDLSFEINHNIENIFTDNSCEITGVKWQQAPKKAENSASYLKISTNGCTGKEQLQLKLRPLNFIKKDEKDEVVYTENKSAFIKNNNQLKNSISFFSDSRSDINISFSYAGEGQCYYLGRKEHLECSFGVEITGGKNTFLTELPEFENIDTKEETQKLNGKNGLVMFPCDGVCSNGLDPWVIKIIKDFKKETKTKESINTQQKIDVNSPCYDKENGGYLDDCYEFLAPIPGIEEGDSNIQEKNGRIYIGNIRNYQLGNYINKMIQIAIALLIVITVIMIIVAGVEYMVVESFYGKTQAKTRISNAVTGLILALSIYLILNTINPKMLDVNFGSGLSTVGVEGGDPDIASVSSLSSKRISSIDDTLKNLNIICPKSGRAGKIKTIANSFKEKVTYTWGGNSFTIGLNSWSTDKGIKTCDPTKTVCADCSGFASLVLYCSGDTNGFLGSTSVLFHNSTSEKIDSIKDDKTVIINGENYTLQVGDLIGSKKGDISVGGKKRKGGHVAIYIGDGKIAESSTDNVGNKLNGNIQISNLTDRTKFISRIHKYEK